MPVPKVESVGEGDENELERPSLYSVWSLVMRKSGGGGSKSRDDAVYHYGYHNLFNVRSDYYSIRVPSLKYTWQACLNCGYFIQNSQASSLPVGKQNHHQQQPQRKILY